jgi:hypothetical protein
MSTCFVWLLMVNAPRMTTHALTSEHCLYGRRSRSQMQLAATSYSGKLSYSCFQQRLRGRIGLEVAFRSSHG